MTQPTNDLEALAAKLDLCRETIIKHYRSGHLEGLPGVVAAGAVVDDVATALRTLAAPKQDAEPVAPLWEICEKHHNPYCNVCNYIIARHTSSHPPAKPDAPAEPTGDADVLAEELMGIHDALNEIPRFDVAVPDLRMDTHLARRILREASAALRSRPASDGAVERVARFITPTVLRYIPDYDEVPPEHIWTRPRYEWLTFAMVQIAGAAIAALRDDQEKGV